MNKLIWSLINADISNHLQKSHKTACKAFEYVFSEKKCWYAMPVHTVTLRALAKPTSSDYVSGELFAHKA